VCRRAAAVHCLATWVPVFHLLPLGPAPEDVSRSRAYQQLRLLFHGAADSRIRSAVLHILVRLECPGLVQVRNAPRVIILQQPVSHAVHHSRNTTRPHCQDLLERCAQETDTEVLTQLYYNGQAMVSQESFHLIESVVDVAQRGLNVRVELAACFERVSRRLTLYISLSRSRCPLNSTTTSEWRPQQFQPSFAS
jgi:hypothetical protein